MKKIQLLDPIIIMGVIISVAVGVILVLMGQDEVSSFIVGLVIAAITVTLDVIVRLKESEKRILETTGLAEVLTENSTLRQTVHEIATSYASVQNSDFHLFVERSNDAIQECKDTLVGLAHGYMATNIGGKYSYGKRGTEEAQSTVKSLAYEDIDSWRTTHLKGVIKANAAASERGVQIKRVFILTNESLDQGKDVLDAHASAGVEVYTVTPDSLPSANMLESFLLSDDKVLVTFYYTRDGRSFRGERISTEPLEVDKALDRFNIILRHAQPYQRSTQ